MRERRTDRSLLVRAHLRCRMEINERRRYKATRGGGNLRVEARGPAASADLWISSGLIGGRAARYVRTLFEFRTLVRVRIRVRMNSISIRNADLAHVLGAGTLISRTKRSSPSGSDPCDLECPANDKSAARRLAGRRK
jgi:hypothetical protein